MGFTNLSKNKVLFFVVVSAFLILMNAGCTRKVEGISTLTISIPSGIGLSKISNSGPPKLTYQSVSITSNHDDGVDWNVVLNPAPLVDASLSQFNCYLIAIAGEEPDMKRNTCSSSTGVNIPVGRWAGGIVAGTPMSLEVPSGPKRQIMVFGIRTTPGSCVNFKTSDMDGSNLSEPFLIGATTQDLASGTIAVSVPISLTTSTLKLAECNGPDFREGDGQAMFFGTATAGTTTVSANTNIASLGGAYSRISNIIVSDPTKTSFTVDSTTDFNVNDEVMLIIMGSNGTTLGPTGNSDFGSCGYRGWNGVYKFGRVLSKSGGTLDINKGTFIDYLHKDADGDGILNESADLVLLNAQLSNAVSTADFCYIQVVKVPHFYDLTLTSTGTLTAPPFSFTGAGGGGILAFRVSNNLTFSSSTSFIDASGLGYQGNTGAVGDGFIGTDGSCSSGSTTGSGGGCGSSPAMTGAGGGHGNQPAYPTYGPFGPSGGDGVGTWGGYGAGEDCGGPSSSDYCFGSLIYKMFMGGAGGGNSNISTAGQNGGGIIYIAAKNIISGGGTIKSNGLPAPDDSNTGGGAGGSVMLSYKTIDDPNNLIVKTMGGKGSDGLSTLIGGGGGGGGRQHFISCKNGTASSAVTTSYINFGVGGSGSTTLGSDGLLGFKATYDVTCL